MASIDVDFEVFKELTIRRKNEAMTENEVIRELLGLSNSTANSETSESSLNDGGSPWFVKGVSFPHGTELRATYKGQQYSGTVQNGALVFDGKRHTSPSSAAVSITGNPVNGWRFWECLQPGANKWKPLASFRR